MSTGERLINACSSVGDANTRERDRERAMAYVPKRVNPTTTFTRKPCAASASSTDLIQRASEANSERSPSTDTQKASTSNGQGSISGVKADRNLAMLSLASKILSAGTARARRAGTRERALAYLIPAASPFSLASLFRAIIGLCGLSSFVTATGVPTHEGFSLRRICSGRARTLIHPRRAIVLPSLPGACIRALVFDRGDIHDKRRGAGPANASPQ